MRARILAYGEEVEKALSSAADGDEAEGAEADANVKYSKLKLQLSEIQRAQATHKRVTKGKGDRKGAQALSDEQEKLLDAQGELLKDKLKSAESDYTFRKTDAGACRKRFITTTAYFDSSRRETLPRGAYQAGRRPTLGSSQRHNPREPVPYPRPSLDTELERSCAQRRHQWLDKLDSGGQRQHFLVTAFA